MPRPNSVTTTRFVIHARLMDVDIPVPCTNTVPTPICGGSSGWFVEHCGEFLTIEEARAQIAERKKHPNNNREFRVCKQTLTVEVM